MHLQQHAALLCCALQEPGSSEAGLSSSNPHAAAPAGPPSEATIAAAAAAAAAFGGGSSNSTVPGHGSSGTQLTSSEYDDLVADVVSNDNSTQLKLADLEAKLEIISPEDLTVCGSAVVVRCVLVTSELFIEFCIIVERNWTVSPFAQYNDLVAENSTQLKLADLEAKLEIISPEDLTVG
jgi:hypothetical protein